MKIYHYAANGMYLGESEADKDPLEQAEVYLIPANATALKPEFAKGLVPFFIDQQWELRDITPPLPTLDELIVSKRREINALFNQAMNQITAGIPSDEIASWDKQEAEARAFTADNNAVTPLLDALAAARGITKADLAARIITKADLFATVSGQLIGTRQALEDQLDVLAEDENATAADIEAVVWPS